jgi:hypothetical protein
MQKPCSRISKTWPVSHGWGRPTSIPPIVFGIFKCYHAWVMVKVNLQLKRIKENDGLWGGGGRKMQMGEEGQKSNYEITIELFSQREHQVLSR